MIVLEANRAPWVHGATGARLGVSEGFSCVCSHLEASEKPIWRIQHNRAPQNVRNWDFPQNLVKFNENSVFGDYVRLDNVEKGADTLLHIIKGRG